MLNNPNEWHDIENEPTDEEKNTPSAAPHNTILPLLTKNTKLIKIGLAIFGLLLLVGLAIHKKMSENTVVKDNNTQLAEYFYDKAATPGTQTNTPPNGANTLPSTENVSGEPTAVVEVNLGTTTQNTAVPVSSRVDIANAPITQNDPLLDKNTVTVKIGDLGRDNPFKPYKNQISTSKYYNMAYNNLGFDVIEPPPAMLEDTKATAMMETTISGIMYDCKNPSAIMNIDGQDQLVRKGDRVFGYTILDITRDKVVIKSGTNIYRASVGQSISTEAINFNQIANLKRKFAGTYNPSVKSIEINAN